MLESHDASVNRLQIISNIPRPHFDNSVPTVGQWQPTVDGGLMRIVYVPRDTDEETIQRLLATP